MNPHPSWQKTLLALSFLVGAVALAQENPPQPGPPPAPALTPPAPPGKGTTAAAKEALARQVVEALRRENPAKFEELMLLRRTDQKAFMEQLQKLGQEWWQRNRKGRAPATREELICQELSWRYHDTKDEAEREKLRTELAEAVEVAFAARVKALETRAAHMEEELKKFQDRLAELKQSRQAVCESRIEELLRPPQLNWDATW